MANRFATWSSVGMSVSGITTVDGVLEKAGLNYEIEKVPLYAGEDKSILVPGQMATVRKDTGKVYGIVGSGYEVCQNADAFDFVNAIRKDLKFDRAGETRGGMVYMIAHGEKVNILNDEFTPYVIFQNGHNGGVSLRASICPLRIVCRNQFNIAFKESHNTVTIRHTSNMSDKLKEAETVLRNISEYMDNFSNVLKSYSDIKVSPEKLAQIIDEFFPITETTGKRAAEGMALKRSLFMNVYNSGDNFNHHGTALGIINGITDYVTHYAPEKKSENWDENRFMYVTFGPALMYFMNKLNAMVF